MTKKVGGQGSFLLQISITVIFVLLLGVLAACGTADQGVTDATPLGEDEGTIIDPTDEMLTEPTDEMLAEPTDEMLAEPTDAVLTEPTDEGAFGDGTDDGAVTLSDVADNPEAYLGQTVTVTGEVSEIVDPQVFRMNEGNLLDIGDEILVVHTADQVTTDLSDDVNIRVTGTVRNFVQADVEQGFDFDFSDDLYVEYENRVAIVADSVEPIATVSNINEDPEAYYGQNVSVIGDVVDLVGVNSFRLDDPALLSGDTVLVIGSEGLIVTEGDTVQVDGVVRQFNLSEVEGETGLDLEDEFFTDFDGRPAIVASSVSVTDQSGDVGDDMGIPVAGDTPGVITLSDVADNPEAYIGQTVTVVGEVSEIIDPQVFRMNEGNLLDIGDEILVVHTADQVTTDLSDDVNIRVTGTVRNFIQADVEQGFDFDFSDDLYVEYENRVAIVADSVEPIPTVSNINDDPEAYYGQNVSVIGDVIELVGVNAFRLDDPALLGGDTLLVVGNEGMTVTEGDTVQVTGTVRQFNLTDVETEMGFDLEDNLFTDSEGRPAIVASSVMPAPAAQ